MVSNYGVQFINTFQSYAFVLLPMLFDMLATHFTLRHKIDATLATYYYKKFHNSYRHPNPLISDLTPITLPDNPPRLRRKWLSHLLNE